MEDTKKLIPRHIELMQKEYEVLTKEETPGDLETTAKEISKVWPCKSLMSIRSYQQSHSIVSHFILPSYRSPLLWLANHLKNVKRV